MTSARILRPDEQAQLEAFLVPRVASSMFLLSNSRKAGLIDAPARHHGSYAAAFENGALVGVAAHYWNGIVCLQAAPAYAPALAELAVHSSQRALSGVVGPSAQVAAVLAARGLAAEKLRSDSEEDLFQLRLADLRVPAPLAEGHVSARAAQTEDLDLLVDVSVAFDVETLNARDTPELRAERRQGEQSGIAEGSIFLLEHEGRCVAASGFNASIPEAVQVGGVYTFPELRGRGFGRCVVAHSLLAVRARGVPTAILFTGQQNHAARRAYLSLGFERIGDYRIAMLDRA